MTTTVLAATERLRVMGGASSEEWTDGQGQLEAVRMGSVFRVRIVCDVTDGVSN